MADTFKADSHVCCQRSFMHCLSHTLRNMVLQYAYAPQPTTSSDLQLQYVLHITREMAKGISV